MLNTPAHYAGDGSHDARHFRYYDIAAKQLPLPFTPRRLFHGRDYWLRAL